MLIRRTFLKTVAAVELGATLPTDGKNPIGVSPSFSARGRTILTLPRRSALNNGSHGSLPCLANALE